MTPSGERARLRVVIPDVLRISEGTPRGNKPMEKVRTDAGSLEFTGDSQSMAAFGARTVGLLRVVGDGAGDSEPSGLEDVAGTRADVEDLGVKKSVSFLFFSLKALFALDMVVVRGDPENWRVSSRDA